MTIGAGLVLVALGAILRFAVADSVDGVDLAMIGNILMIVGAVGALLSLLLTQRRGGVVVERRDDYI